jgi:hypothetical protein
MSESLEFSEVLSDSERERTIDEMTKTLSVVAAARNLLAVSDCPNPIEYHPCRRMGCPHCDLVVALHDYDQK